MKRFVKRAAITLLSFSLFILSLAVADAFLFRYRALHMFRSVQEVPIGTPVDRIRWLERRYRVHGGDGYEKDVVMQVGLTTLDYVDRRGGIRIFPRNLLMRPAGAWASFTVSDNLVTGRRASLGMFKDRSWLEGPVASVEAADLLSAHRR